MTAPSTHPVITLRGVSGVTYRFTLYPLTTEFRSVCAVYVIVSLRADGYHVVYIGQTEDCSARFDIHHKAFCFARHGSTHIGLMLEDAEPRRLAIEADLVRNYDPPCNG